MNRRTYRKKWLRLHERYVKIGFREFSRSLNDSLSKIPWDQIDKDNYEFIIRNFITNKPIVDAYEEFYTVIGINYGNKIGKAINAEQKLFNPFNFQSGFRQFIKNLILSNFGKKIISVRESLIEEVINIFAEGFDCNDNAQEIARDIRNKVGKANIYRWQTMRIARTEATGAANLGAIKASEQSGVQLEKEWISTIDKRTRRKPPSAYDHLDMDGITVDEGKPFNVNGDLIQFPGDPDGEPGNIINCRCTIAMLIKRDSEGRILRKSEN